MPGLGVWACKIPSLESPDEVKQTALYLTATSTSTEVDTDSLTQPKSSMFAELSEAAATRPAYSLSSTSPSSQTPGPSSHSPFDHTQEEKTAVLAQPVTTSASSDTDGKNATPPEAAAIDSTSVQPKFIALDANAPSRDSQAPSETAAYGTEPTAVLKPETAQESPVPQGQVGNADSLANSPPTATSSPILTNNQLATPVGGAQPLVAGQPFTSALKSESTALPIAPPAFTIGSQAVTADSQNQYLVEGQTLTPGGTVIASGTTVALAADASQVVVGTSTHGLGVIVPPAFTIGGETVTANAQNQYLVEGQTLTPGDVVTASGTMISLAASATDVVVGSSTQGLGGLIMSGLGGAPVGTIGVGGGAGGSAAGGGSANATGTGILGFTGGAGKKFDGLTCMLNLVIVATLVVVWL